MAFAGGVVYSDGQFDDSRLLISLMETAADHNAVVLNYAGVVELQKDAEGFINGVTVIDGETNERFSLQAKVVVNATGIFTDEVRRMADDKATVMVQPSQGIHLVLDKSFLRGRNGHHGAAHQRRACSFLRFLGMNIPSSAPTDTPIEKASYEASAI